MDGDHWIPTDGLVNNELPWSEDLEASSFKLIRCLWMLNIGVRGIGVQGFWSVKLLRLDDDSLPATLAMTGEIGCRREEFFVGVLKTP